jgi:hypothetical protein
VYFLFDKLLPLTNVYLEFFQSSDNEVHRLYLLELLPGKRLGQTEIPVFIKAFIPAYPGELNECRPGAGSRLYPSDRELLLTGKRL